MRSRSHTPVFAVLCAAAALALCACSGGGGGGASPVVPMTPGNVLIVVADDVGTDMIAAYHEHPDAPPTPTLDALAADGVLFKNAYACPTCSPTRAAIMTGRYSFRTGLGTPIQEWNPEYALPLDEVTLPEMLNQVGLTHIANSAVGKWHLGSTLVGDIEDANLQGFDWFEGTFGNFFFGQTYYDHSKIINGVRINSTTYATTEQADDAIARIQAMPEPWFCYLAFNSGHQPFHAPPAYLHTYTLAGDPELTPNLHFCAAVQALDTELGRVLATLTPEVRANTTIIFIGDNGTPNEAVIPPSIAGQAKGSLYEGGVRVPLIVSGKRVQKPGTTCTALVHAVDLFPTVADLFDRDYRAGVGDNRPIDGLTLMPFLAEPAAPTLHPYLFSEKFAPNGYGPYATQGWTIRDERWKLMRRQGLGDSLFDLQGVTREGANLLLGPLTPEQQAAYTQLQDQLSAVLNS